MTRVLVCGGRELGHRNRDELWSLMIRLNELQDERGPLTIMEGGAAGADCAAWFWAQLAGCECETFKANWLKHGRAAGPIRNTEMIRNGKPDLVLAFPGGSGTADCVEQAKAAGIEVIEVPPTGGRA